MCPFTASGAVQALGDWCKIAEIKHSLTSNSEMPLCLPLAALPALGVAEGTEWGPAACPPAQTDPQPVPPSPAGAVLGLSFPESVRHRFQPAAFLVELLSQPPPAVQPFF